MAEMANRICQFTNCNAIASKHATYGFQSGDPESGDHGVRIPISTRHADFCEMHLADLKKQYSDVTELDLGECRDCH